jgi:predicted  nucleic acid-binding Zn-ribbon protein
MILEVAEINKGKKLNKDLEQLVQLSKYDIEITQLEPKIEIENEKLNVFLKVIEDFNKKIDELYVIIDDNKNKRIKNDIHLKELASKLKDIESKGKVVKTEKEIKALQLEEEIAKEQISFANDEIVRLDALIISKKDELIALKKELSVEEESVIKINEVVSTKIQDLETARTEASQNRTYLFAKVDKKVLSFYEKIRRWAKETAVVPVKNQACYGCHMKITDRLYYEFIRSDEIKTCPHCGRIIYLEEIVSE